MTRVSGQPDDLDEISDEELAAWYEQVRRSAENASVEDGWHGQPHAADPMPLSRVREELRRAGYTAADIRQDEDSLLDPGSKKHNRWHVTHPGQTHG